MKIPMIDQFFANESRLMFDTDAIRCEKAEAIALANELRALLADRERLAGQVTEWEGHAQTYEAGMVSAQRELAHMTKQAKDAWSAAESYRVKAEATTTPRRLREYKGVVYRDDCWETPDGKRYEMASGVVWNKSVTLSLTDLDIPALLALRDEPQPVETLESLIEPALTAMYELGWDRHGGSSDKAAEDLAKEIRAWLATQPQAITPEQAVAVLVAHGARRSTAWNSVIATGGGNHAVLILPTATPEGGK